MGTASRRVGRRPRRASRQWSGRRRPTPALHGRPRGGRRPRPGRTGGRLGGSSTGSAGPAAPAPEGPGAVERAGAGATTSVGSVMGSVAAGGRVDRSGATFRTGPVGRGDDESRSNSQGRRSASVSSVSSSDPRATSSSANMAGSNSSSWATQSASSSRQVGAHDPGWPGCPPRCRGRAPPAPGRWAARSSGAARSAVAGAARHRGLPGSHRIDPGPAPRHRPGSSVRWTVGWSNRALLPGLEHGPPGPRRPSSSARSTSSRTTGSSPVISPAGSAPTIRTRSVAGPVTAPPASRRVTGGRSGSRHPLPLGRRPRQLFPSIHRGGPARPGVRSRGAPAPCGRAAGRWRPRGPG